MATAKVAEEAVLELLRKHSEGVSQELMSTELAHIPLEARMDVLNRLLGARRLKLFHGPNNSLIYKQVDVEEATKFKGLNAEELMLYQVIKNAGTTGIWTKDMKVRTNLAQPQITKILKTLEGRRLVKSVKNVNNPSRKVYMLFELEPSRELTGGAWYTESQFDSEFIEVLREACYAYIQRMGDTTLADIAAFIRTKGFSRVDLRDEDIQSVVSTLIYDGRVDQVEGEGENEVDDHYRPAALAIPSSTAFTSMPCGVCPVFAECREDGLISPQSCIYYDKWLEF